MSDCIFCKIVKKEISADIVYEDENIVAFKDINPKAPVHILIIPREHISTLNEVTDYTIIGKIIEVTKKLAVKNNIDKEGYRVVVNCNAAAGQAVYHLHFHLLGGRSMHWPPG